MERGSAKNGDELRTIVFVALVSLAHSVVVAQESDSATREARAFFDRAMAAYDAELYTEAEDSFRRAYELMPATRPRRALILQNLALSIERQGGRDVDALRAWREFRDAAESVAEPDQLAHADARIEELTRRAARRSDGPSSTGSVHIAGPIVLVLGGTAAVAGAVVGIVGLEERNAILALCSGTECPGEAEGRAADLETFAALADALIWPGLAIAAAGVVLTMTLREASDAQPEISCGPGGCVMAWRWWCGERCSLS